MLFQLGVASKKINQCVCRGLRQAVGRLLTSTRQTCDDNQVDTREGKLFNWEETVDILADAYYDKGKGIYGTINDVTGIGGNNHYEIKTIENYLWKTYP